MKRLVSLIFFIVTTIQQCQLGGYKSGLCTRLDSKPADFLPFCRDLLPQLICLNEGEEFGRNLNIKKKELKIQNFFHKTLSTQVYREFQSTLKTSFFITNKICLTAYKKFLCRINFPECNSTGTIGVPLADCQELITSCGFNIEFCTIKMKQYVSLEENATLLKKVLIIYLGGLRVGF